MLFVIQSSDQKNPLEEKMATHSTIFFFFSSTPLLLPVKSNGQRNLVGYSPWDPKELDTTE